MSQITEKDVVTIAKLARIEVLEDKRQQVASGLNKVIGWVESLNEVDVSKTAPLTNVHNMAMPLSSDEIKIENNDEQVLRNAPQVKYNYFTVPKVIE